MKIFLAFILLFICCSAASLPQGSDAANEIKSALASNKHVRLYFVSRTETYNWEGDKFKSEAGLIVYRGCGSNCANLMGAVVKHLYAAKRVACNVGQQSMLIEIGEKTLTYSYSSRMIKLDGICYFNANSLSKLDLKSVFFD